MAALLNCCVTRVVNRWPCFHRRPAIPWAWRRAAGAAQLFQHDHGFLQPAERRVAAQGREALVDERSPDGIQARMSAFPRPGLRQHGAYGIAQESEVLLAVRAAGRCILHGIHLHGPPRIGAYRRA